MRSLALAGLLAASSVEAFSPASGFATPAGLRLPKDKVLSFYPPPCVKCGAAISHGNSGGRRKIPAQDQLPCWSFEFCPTTGLAPLACTLHAPSPCSFLPTLPALCHTYFSHPCSSALQLQSVRQPSAYRSTCAGPSMKGGDQSLAGKVAGFAAGKPRS